MNRLVDVCSEDLLFTGFSAAIGVGIVYGTFKFFNRIYSNTPPKTWRKVGVISEVWCFPIKSCGPVQLKTIGCDTTGIEFGELRDRAFMVSRLNGEFVTARTYPKMVKIMPKVEGKMLIVTAPGMNEIKVDIEKLYSSKKTINCNVWKDKANCVDCGDEAAAWFSKFILGTNEGFRLVFYPSHEPKPVIEEKGYLFEQADRMDTGILHDEASFMLMNQGSFDDLNTKIDKPVVPLQYRPNFVVKGAKAWEEDNWKWVKIGDQTMFKYVQPCTRCILTNIDPSTGERNPEMEPLKTLRTFRNFANIDKTSPFFGIHLGVRTKGQVSVGDSVYVNA